MTNKFYSVTKNNKPAPLLIKAMEYVKEKNIAIDLGCGAGKDVKYLLNQKFKKVEAIDKSLEAIEIVNKAYSRKELFTSNELIENYEFKESEYDLINAQFSLSFLNPVEFKKVILKIKKSLKPNGIFCGQIFGNRDEWSVKPGMTFLDKKELLKIISPLEILYFTEIDKHGKLATGEPKYWHFYNLILKKV